jgi:hypothetical protein
LLGGTEDNHEISVRMADVRAEIRNVYLKNTIEKRYHMNHLAVFLLQTPLAYVNQPKALVFTNIRVNRMTRRLERNIVK